MRKGGGGALVQVERLRDDDRQVFRGASDREGQVVSERLMEDAITSQSNRWRYVGDRQ